jgi:hypothetical protein
MCEKEGCNLSPLLYTRLRDEIKHHRSRDVVLTLNAPFDHKFTHRLIIKHLRLSGRQKAKEHCFRIGELNPGLVGTGYLSITESDKS